MQDVPRQITQMLWSNWNCLYLNDAGSDGKLIALCFVKAERTRNKFQCLGFNFLVPRSSSTIQSKVELYIGTCHSPIDWILRTSLIQSRREVCANNSNAVGNKIGTVSRTIELSGTHSKYYSHKRAQNVYNIYLIAYSSCWRYFCLFCWWHRVIIGSLQAYDLRKFCFILSASARVLGAVGIKQFATLKNDEYEYSSSHPRHRWNPP